MNILCFVIVLCIVQFLCFYASLRAREGVSNQKEYFLAGNRVLFFPLMMTFVATQIGGGIILGSADEAYRNGWWVLLYPLGAVLGFLLLSSRVGAELSKFKVGTVAQIFEQVYGSSTLKKIASTLSILSLFFILVAQVLASRKFLMSISPNQEVFFIGLWALIIASTVMGGLHSVLVIDVIQASFFILTLAVGFVVVVSSQGSLTSLSDFSAFGNMSFDQSKFVGWLFMPLLFMIIEQDMAQRCFSAKSPQVMLKAARWSALLILLVCVIPISFGILARNSGLVISENQSVFMSFLQEATSPYLSAFLAVAVMMAIISTAISMINSVASNVALDFDLKWLDKYCELKVSRWISIAVGVFAVVVSYRFKNIVELMIASYELSVSCMFVPIFAALVKWKRGVASAYCSLFCGALGFVLFRIIDIGFSTEILSVALSFLGYLLGDFIFEQRGFE